MLEVGLIDAEMIHTIGKSARNRPRIVTMICPIRRLRRCSREVLPLLGRLLRAASVRIRLPSPEGAGVPCSDIFRDFLPHAHEAILEYGDRSYNDEDHDGDGIGIPIIRPAAGFKGHPECVRDQNISIPGPSGRARYWWPAFVVRVDHGEII